MSFRNTCKRWFAKYNVILSAIPGFLFWTFVLSGLGINYFFTIAVLLCTKLAVTFLIDILDWFNEYLLYYPERPYYAFSIKVRSSKLWRNCITSYENWFFTLDQISQSVIMVPEQIVIGIVLFISVVGAIGDLISIVLSE
jgi:hypothetical protein